MAIPLAELEAQFSLATNSIHQMPNGFGPVFLVVMKSSEQARRLPSKLRIFQHATSLGGVESLIEWRKMTDPNAGDDVMRISIGIE